MNIFEISGLIGFTGYIGTYAMLQSGVLADDQLKYSLLNLLSASLVLISLVDTFNTASALIQVCWILISIWGLWRVRGLRKKTDRRRQRRKRRSYARVDWVV